MNKIACLPLSPVVTLVAIDSNGWLSMSGNIGACKVCQSADGVR